MFQEESPFSQPEFERNVDFWTSVLGFVFF